MPGPTSQSSELARQMEQMLEARVTRLLEHRETLALALDAIAEELPAGLYRHELRVLVEKLNRGAAADELCRVPKTADLLLPLLAAGPQPAVAVDRCHKILAESCRELDLRRQQRRVFAYPAVVALIAVAVLVFLCIVVVPVYGQIFRSFGLVLPGLTKGILQLSEWLRFRSIGVALVMIAAGSVFYLLWRLAASLSLFDRIFGYLTSGNSREVSALATFTQRLAEGLAAELPLPVAICLAGRSSHRRAIQRAARQLAEDAADSATQVGRSPAAGRFPATLIYALSDSGCLAGARPSASDVLPPDGGAEEHDAALSTRVRLLRELAEVYADRVRYRRDWSSGIRSQFSLVLVGLIVGTVLLALLLPLFQLINSLS